MRIWRESEFIRHPNVLPIFRVMVGNNQSVVNEWGQTDVAYHFQVQRAPVSSQYQHDLDGVAATLADHFEWWGFRRSTYGTFCPAVLDLVYVGSRYTNLLTPARLYTHPLDRISSTPFMHITPFPVEGFIETSESVGLIATAVKTELDGRGLSYPMGLHLDLEPYQNPPLQGPCIYTGCRWNNLLPNMDGLSSWDLLQEHPGWDGKPVVERPSGQTYTMAQLLAEYGNPPGNANASVHAPANDNYVRTWTPLWNEIHSYWVSKAIYEAWESVFPGSIYGNYDSFRTTGSIENPVPTLNPIYSTLPLSNRMATWQSPSVYNVPKKPGVDPPQTAEEWKRWRMGIFRSIQLAGGRLNPWVNFLDYPHSTEDALLETLLEVSACGGYEAVLWTNAMTLDEAVISRVSKSLMRVMELWTTLHSNPTGRLPRGTR